MRWRTLGRFWAVVVGAAAGGAMALQALGPLPAVSTNPAPAATTVAPVAPKPLREPPQVAAGLVQPTLPPVHPGRDTPGPIADPDPALLEPAPGIPDASLPRIGTDGRLAMQVYAAGFDRTTRRPRVGVLLTGLGTDAAASEAAIRATPGAVSLAFSPYAPAPDRLLAIARLTEHEFLVAVPIGDGSDYALAGGAGAALNRQRLDWALSRLGGYVGAVAAAGPSMPPAALTPVLAALQQRGLLYVDPRPGQPPAAGVWQRVADIVVDGAAGARATAAQLAALEAIARSRGSALAVAAADPAIVTPLAAWAAGLRDRGLVLAPVSALVQPPTGEPP